MVNHRPPVFCNLNRPTSEACDGMSHWLTWETFVHHTLATTQKRVSSDQIGNVVECTFVVEVSAGFVSILVHHTLLEPFKTRVILYFKSAVVDQMNKLDVTWYIFFEIHKVSITCIFALLKFENQLEIIIW